MRFHFLLMVILFVLATFWVLNHSFFIMKSSVVLMAIMLVIGISFTFRRRRS